MRNKLENIMEEGVDNWLSAPCLLPKTPTESMEFLGRSWSVSSVEVSRVLSHTYVENPNLVCNTDGHQDRSTLSREHQPEPVEKAASPPVSPRENDEMKVYTSIMRGRAIGRWIKDQKERRKHELRTHNAQLHAAVSVAGVAAAVAALTFSSATLSKNLSDKEHSKTSNAIASAAALVASHCIEIAEDMGADHDQILSAINSATNARTNGDIMTLTAGAATALRGAATLQARLQKCATTTVFTENLGEERKEVNVLASLNFVFKGGELLKLTRKGDLHWKQVSFKVNTKWQVVAKMKSKLMGGTFTKKEKLVVSGVYVDVPAWPGREMDDSNQERQYFGIETSKRIIEFECSNKDEKDKWIKGLQHLLNSRANIPRFI
ncbi:hypothetical protein LXL04_003689 [Taraxacum kok-saghyz]